MICHTTYETLKGEPVFPKPTPQFYSQNTGSLEKCSASTYNSPNILRRPLLKDINFYLNKAENQLIRQQQHPHVSNRNFSNPNDATSYATVQRRQKPANNVDGRRKTYIESSNRGEKFSKIQ